ncbi:MAG: hypothetical protein ACLFPV_09900 [Spirochaetaceae bacterium]
MKNPYHVPTIRAAIARSATLVLKTHAYRPRERDYIDEVLGLSLEAIGRGDLRTQLSYCLHELASNAKRANTKRAFFLEQGLDLNNPIDYARGMERFKSETVPNIEHYLQQQRSLGLYIRFRFRRSVSGLTVSVINNAVPTVWEWQRIQEKFSVASGIDAIPDAVPRIQDETEGAGLGIVMMIMILRNLGLPADTLTVGVTKEQTVASLHIPGSENRHPDAEKSCAVPSIRRAALSIVTSAG